jgi:hypothetical protein
LHVIKRVEDSEKDGTEWSGRLRAIKDSVGKVAKAVNGVEAAVKEGLSQKLDGIGDRIGAVEGTLNHVMEKQEVSQRPNSIEAKLDMRVGAIETTLDTRVGAIQTTLDTRVGAIQTMLDMRVGAIETTFDTRVGAIEAQLNKISAQLLLAMPASAQSKQSLAEETPITRSDGPISPPIAKLQSWAASIVGQNKMNKK